MTNDETRYASVCVDIASLEKGAGGGKPGPIWGKIWIDGPDFDFPALQWWDLAAALVADLLDASRFLVSNPSDRRVINFFDGPHRVSITARSSAVWDFELVSDNTGKRQTVSVDAHSWLESVRTAASGLVESCDMRSWVDPDVERIRKMISTAGS